MTAIITVHQCLFCPKTFDTAIEKDDHVLDHFAQETCMDCGHKLLRIGGNLYTIHNAVTCVRTDIKTEETQCYFNQTEQQIENPLKVTNDNGNRGRFAIEESVCMEELHIKPEPFDQYEQESTLMENETNMLFPMTQVATKSHVDITPRIQSAASIENDSKKYTQPNSSNVQVNKQQLKNNHTINGAPKRKQMIEPTMNKKSSFKKLQKIIGKLLPRGLDSIVYEAGFDSEYSLSKINAQSIKLIEDYINENKHILRGTLYESVIAQKSVFKLKPGHKAVILNLPQELKDCRPKKIPEPMPDMMSFEDEKATLSEALVRKITNFASKHSFDIALDVAQVFEYRRENGIIKCSVECPFCVSRIKCYYERYWRVSNFEKHLKMLHFGQTK